MEFNGAKMYGKWHYLEVVRQQKLVSIVSFTDEKGTIISHPGSPSWPKEIHSTVTFTDNKSGKTEVLVEWKAYNATNTESQTFADGKESMNQGWGGSFDQLAECLKPL
jgi:uncharacterized protein YndB with AHSA1/START domain